MTTGREQISQALEAPIPDVIEPIIGFRMWNWDEKGLTSQRGTFWKPGEVLTAECKPSGYGFYVGGAKVADPAWQRPTCPVSPSAPWRADEQLIHDAKTGEESGTIRKSDPIHGEYGCGIYAYTTIEDAWRNLHNTDASNAVIGEVELWGNVWPHEHGYRGQFARVRALYRPVGGRSTATIWSDPFDALARFYGVEVKDVPLGADERKAIEEAEKEKRAAAADGVRTLFRDPSLFALPPLTDEQKAERAERERQAKRPINRIKKAIESVRNFRKYTWDDDLDIYDRRVIIGGASVAVTVGVLSGAAMSVVF